LFKEKRRRKEMTAQQPTPLSNAEQLAGMVSQLQQELQQQLPGYERLLHEIHVRLSKEEDLVHFLTEEQIGIIVAALCKKKNIVIQAAELNKKTKTASGKKLKDIGLDEL
jgi:hypothetical protein